MPPRQGRFARTGYFEVSARRPPDDDGLSGNFNPPDGDLGNLRSIEKLTLDEGHAQGHDSAEDAELRSARCDGIIVSNHGGRAAETLRATIDCLPEVAKAVRGRVPVFLDGGVRHGADIYKALASGARGVGMGRPYIWGLSAFGQAGVERVLEILRAELTLTMRQMITIKDITLSVAGPNFAGLGGRYCFGLLEPARDNWQSLQPPGRWRSHVDHVLDDSFPILPAETATRDGRKVVTARADHLHHLPAIAIRQILRERSGDEACSKPCAS
jgi:hypothetical protein